MWEVAYIKGLEVRASYIYDIRKRKNKRDFRDWVEDG